MEPSEKSFWDVVSATLFIVVPDLVSERNENKNYIFELTDDNGKMLYEKVG